MSDSDNTSISIPLEELTLSYVDNIVFINPETYPEDQASKALDDIILKKSTELEIEHNLASLAVSEKNSSISFFEQSLDQPPHFSNDYAKLREFIIDWYSAQKTLVTKSRKSLDLNILPNDELNELILSLGFPYPKYIISKSHKIQFISSLFEMYKRKGTAFALWNVLSLYGLGEVNISEWWVKFDERRNPKIFMESKPIYPEKNRTNHNLILTKEIDDVILTDPYWQQTNYDLLQAVNNKDNLISLPSITPFISIDTYSNFSKAFFDVSIIQRKIYETLNYWITKTLIPLDLSAYGITEVLQDMPLINEPFTEYPPNHEIEDHPAKNILFMVGPNPKEGTVFEGHAKELAIRIEEEGEEDTWQFIEVDAGIAFISRKDSDIYPNKLIKIEVINGERKFKVFSVSKNTTIQFSKNWFLSDNFRPKSTLVFNGYEWVMLNKVIPADLFNKNKVSKEIYRDVPLNGFSSLYSPYEVSLALAYIFKNSYVATTQEPFLGSTSIAAKILRDFTTLDISDNNRISYSEALASEPTLTEAQYNILNGLITTSGEPGVSKEELLLATRTKRHFFYNGVYSPLDGKYGSIDNIDDLYKTSSPYRPLKLELERLYDYDLREDTTYTTTTFRHVSPAFPYKRDTYTDPRFLREKKLEEFYSKYTKIVTPVTEHEIAPQQNPKSYLKAINPDFLNELEEHINMDKDAVFESILLDFENYLINNMTIVDSPFAYAITGADFLKKLTPVINFFKPFRVRINDFAASIRIDDYLLDSFIPGDNDTIGAEIDKTIYEKPFPLDYNRTQYDLDDPLFDNGIPMSEYCVNSVQKYIFEGYPNPDSPITTSKILLEDATSPTDYAGYLDRNLLDLKMNDFLIIQITSYDNDDNIFYEYEVKIDDYEYKSLTVQEKFIHDPGEEVIDGLLEGSPDTFLYDLVDIRDIEAFFTLNVDTNMFEVDIKHKIDDLDTTGQGALILAYANADDLSGASIEPTAIDLSEETFFISIDKEVHYTNLSTYEDCYLVITFQIIGNPILHLKYIKLNNILDYLSAQQIE